MRRSSGVLSPYTRCAISSALSGRFQIATSSIEAVQYESPAPVHAPIASGVLALAVRVPPGPVPSGKPSTYNELPVAVNVIAIWRQLSFPTTLPPLIATLALLWRHWTIARLGSALLRLRISAEKTPSPWRPNTAPAFPPNPVSWRPVHLTHIAIVPWGSPLSPPP